jgi:uncharacterized protein YegP (UPF0339 family)
MQPDDLDVGSPDLAKGGLAMARFELYRDNRGEYRWRLKSSSGRSIATSGEAYKTPDAAQDSIAAVKRDAATAGVDDQTETTF